MTERIPPKAGHEYSIFNTCPPLEDSIVNSGYVYLGGIVPGGTRAGGGLDGNRFDICRAF